MALYKEIPVNATIRDVLPTLTNKEEYVRIVLGHMRDRRTQHGHAFVRIGVTGSGKIPSHKIVYNDPEGNEILFDAWGENTPFRGVKIHEQTWSQTRMSWDEVSALIGEIRNYKPERPRR